MTQSSETRVGSWITGSSFAAWYAQNRGDVDALVFDIDGVLMAADRPVTGSAGFLAACRRDAVPYVLLTNDGSRAPADKAARLERAGIPVPASHLVSASHGLDEVVAENGWQGHRFLVLGDLGDPCYAEAAGLQPVFDPREWRSCCGVVVGENEYDWEPAVTGAVNLLVAMPDAPLVIPNPDRFFVGHSIPLHIAAGAVGRFVADLVAAYTGRRPVPLFLGKPFQPIFRHCHRVLERLWGRRIEPGRVVIVGDSLGSDIAGGNRYGYRTALVLTGVTRPDHSPEPGEEPDLVFERLGDPESGPGPLQMHRPIDGEDVLCRPHDSEGPFP